MILKRIGPLSCAKIAGVLNALIGLMAGAVVSIAAVAGAFTQNLPGFGFGALMGVGAILFMPIFYGIIGFLTALFSAWFYNMLAERVGGIELEFDGGTTIHSSL